MAKEAICALLAILEHFFEAFSPLDLFFAPAPFRPAPRPFPASLHPGCRRFSPLPIPFLYRFQPIPSPARPLKSTSSRPGSHPSRRHPPVLSSSSELLSLSTSAALRGRLPSPHRLSLRRLVAIARATTPSASPQAIMSAPAPSTMSPQAARPLVCFCSSRATIFRHLRLPSLSLAALPHQSPSAPSCVHPPLPAPSSPSSPSVPSAPLALSALSAPRRAHQTPFYARGLQKIIAVSENAPGAHGDVPRAGGCSTNGRSGDGTCR